MNGQSRKQKAESSRAACDFSGVGVFGVAGGVEPAALGPAPVCFSSRSAIGLNCGLSAAGVTALASNGSQGTNFSAAFGGGSVAASIRRRVSSGDRLAGCFARGLGGRLQVLNFWGSLLMLILGCVNPFSSRAFLIL
jgi:hypothetical protein